MTHFLKFIITRLDEFWANNFTPETKVDWMKWRHLSAPTQLCLPVGNETDSNCVRHRIMKLTPMLWNSWQSEIVGWKRQWRLWMGVILLHNNVNSNATYLIKGWIQQYGWIIFIFMVLKHPDLALSYHPPYAFWDKYLSVSKSMAIV